MCNFYVLYNTYIVLFLILAYLDAQISYPTFAHGNRAPNKNVVMMYAWHGNQIVIRSS